MFFFLTNELYNFNTIQFLNYNYDNIPVRVTEHQDLNGP